jgi:site-specific recombinase XerD
MTTLNLRSSMAQVITNFVTFKRMEGFSYTCPAKYLTRFDAFLHEQGFCQTTLNQQIVDAYIAHTANLSPNGRYTQLSTVRVFSRYLNRLDSESYVLHEIPCKRPTLPRWYLYSPGDIAALLRHSKTLGPVGSLRPHCFHTLVGLLYATGLRISEALALNSAT